MDENPYQSPTTLEWLPLSRLTRELLESLYNLTLLAGAAMIWWWVYWWAMNLICGPPPGRF